MQEKKKVKGLAPVQIDIKVEKKKELGVDDMQGENKDMLVENVDKLVANDDKLVVDDDMQVADYYI